MVILMGIFYLSRHAILINKENKPCEGFRKILRGNQGRPSQGSYNYFCEATMTKIGILHPGEMGISIAASAINNGHQGYWVSAGRSDQTRARAEKYDLIEIDSLVQFCKTCEIIMSVCPPHAAEEVARSVVETGFKGLYLDANAISLQRAVKIRQTLETGNIQFVDGGIIGGPAWKPKETWLYLSGEYAQEIASCFSEGPLETKIIGDEIGKASSLKMCYAAYSKGTTALLSAVLATAESLGVREELYLQWDMDDKDFSEQVNRRVTRLTAKAWRFEGEMHEIASTFQESGLPNGFHKAAGEIYHRMAKFKDSIETPPLNHVLKALLTQ
jgi:3-hydroxyisobutyrate dehydrogenase-like beta-hydroxyacid dehydrogenase